MCCVSGKTSVVSAAKTSVVSADKRSAVCQDIPSSLPTQGMSWQTADFLSADTTDVLAADATDALPADPTHVLPEAGAWRLEAWRLGAGRLKLETPVWKDLRENSSGRACQQPPRDQMWEVQGTTTPWKKNGWPSLSEECGPVHGPSPFLLRG